MCEILIRKEHIFSINETIKDISTGMLLKKVYYVDDIKYLIVGYYLGFVFQKGMEDRFERLERATSYLESFLDVLKRCEVLEKEEQAQYDGYLEYLV